jgi:two-component system, chemotaxis family, chemotaxis protein CheY
MPAASALRVLVVDDQLTSRMLIREGLQQIGITHIEMAKDGEEGLKMMMTKPAHLVISDYNMPKLDGIEFLRAVRSHEPIAKCAFIILSGRGDKELVYKAVRCGVNNYLVKPFTVPALRAQIEGVIGKLT